MDEQEEVQQNNMISNLPLLFANGYPTSLEKISESQLECFIPFMVRCSLGHINQQEKFDCSEPEWWPEDLPFTIPFCKPKKFDGNWMEKMKEIVFICYQFHKSIFLLRFCNDLSSHEPASLRFINNYNCTTSLFDRRSNKLLVTFRNENMSYDQPQRIRKSLLQQKSKNDNKDEYETRNMVEPAPFDIYLCDNCDAELYSKEAILDHEKTCSIDDDVILCDTPEPKGDEESPSISNCNDDTELRKGFLFNFNLQPRSENKFVKTLHSNATCAREENFTIIDRNRRMPRRNRAVHSLTRCPTIPLSSPAGKLLLRTTKAAMTSEYLTERLERIERFCHTPLLAKPSIKPKYLDKKCFISNPHCSFKKPQEYSSHIYIFPRRQFSQRRRTENFLFLNSTLLKRCRPISVRLKKITEEDMLRRHTISNTGLNIKLTRDTTRRSNWKILPASSSGKSSPRLVIDTIDLCSSDDDGDLNNAGSNAFQRNVLCSSSLPMTASLHKTEILSSHLKKLNEKFSSSEISLVPLKRTPLINGKQTKGEQSKTVKIMSSSTGTEVNDRTTVRLLNTRLDDIVIGTSTSASNVTESAVALPKPLRPSVYILSNYLTATSTSMPATISNTTEIDVVIEDVNFRSQNQENHVQKIVNTNASRVAAKRSNSIISSASTNRYSGGSINSFNSNSQNNNNNNNNNNINNNENNNNINNNENKNISIERECVSRSLSLGGNFNSSSRIVSIDLTS